MAEWLLTEEEIKRELAGSGIESSPYIGYACAVVAKAQARQLVEWLQLHGEEGGLLVDEWQALCKEVELEVE